MDADKERRLRSIAAHIVDLELRVNLLRSANIAGKTHEELQQMRGDLLVTEHLLWEAKNTADSLKYSAGDPT